VVQLYVHDEVATVTRPGPRVGRFRRVSLKPGEARTLDFQLTAKELGLYNRDMKFVVEPGKFRVFVGGSSVGGLEAEFEVGGRGDLVEIPEAPRNTERGRRNAEQGPRN